MVADSHRWRTFQKRLPLTLISEISFPVHPRTTSRASTTRNLGFPKHLFLNPAHSRGRCVPRWLPVCAGHPEQGCPLGEVLPLHLPLARACHRLSKAQPHEAERGAADVPAPPRVELSEASAPHRQHGAPHRCSSWPAGPAAAPQPGAARPPGRPASGAPAGSPPACRWRAAGLAPQGVAGLVPQGAAGRDPGSSLTALTTARAPANTALGTLSRTRRGMRPPGGQQAAAPGTPLPATPQARRAERRELPRAKAGGRGRRTLVSRLSSSGSPDSELPDPPSPARPAPAPSAAVHLLLAAQLGNAVQRA